MLVNPGDLIPVLPGAVSIPWTRRKSQILNFLHRGPVNFATLVYDTNVGDISTVATYFNPERVSVKDLNTKYGHHPNVTPGDSIQEGTGHFGHEAVKPRLLLYPEHREIQEDCDKTSKEQRTLSWVLTNEPDELDYLKLPPIGQPLGFPGGSSRSPSPPRRTVPPPPLGVAEAKFHTAPASSLGRALDEVWMGKGSLETEDVSTWGVMSGINGVGPWWRT